MGHVSYFSELTSDTTSRIERNTNSSISASSEIEIKFPSEMQIIRKNDAIYKNKHAFFSLLY